MEAYIDPISGGLKFIERKNENKDNAQRNQNINSQFQPKLSKYVPSISTVKRIN